MSSEEASEGLQELAVVFDGDELDLVEHRQVEPHDDDVFGIQFGGLFTSSDELGPGGIGDGMELNLVGL